MYLNNRFKCIQAEWPASMLTSPIDQKCGLWVLTWNFQSDKIKEIISIWKSDADQDLPCNQKALTWIAASSPLNLGSERGMGPIPDSSYSPLSFKVCFKAPNCLEAPSATKRDSWITVLTGSSLTLRAQRDQPILLQLSKCSPTCDD